VLLIFKLRGECYLFVFLYKGAHPSRRGRATWESGVIPNWPHITEHSTAAQSYDCVPVSCVESVHFLAPDIDRPGYHWVVRPSGTRLWHERYSDVDDGEEGDLSKLEPDAFEDPHTNYEEDDLEASDLNPPPSNSDATDTVQTQVERSAEASRYATQHENIWTGNIDDDC
jgi:hypothetical protein